MWSPEDLNYLEAIAKFASSIGEVKSFNFKTPSGLSFNFDYDTYREIAKTSKNPLTQIFNISANATATSSLSLSQNFQNILQDMEASNLEPEKVAKVRKELNNLETELNKPDPSERTIKRILRWASNFSFELFLRLSVLLAERFLKPM